MLLSASHKGDDRCTRPVEERSLGKMRWLLTVLAASFLLASCFLLAQQETAPKHPMTFFVTSTPIGDGGNLGGLAGADAHCQSLAAAVGASNHTWHAYLSTQARPGQPAINARDRIGTCPWYNVKGEMIAPDLAHLHGDTLELARLGNNLNKLTGLTEKGEMVPGLYDYADPRDTNWDYVKTTTFSNRHEMLTGSQPDGRAFADNVDHTCDNWTSNKDPEPGTANGNLNAADGRPNAQIGFPDRNGGGNGSWNSSHGTRGCSQQSLICGGAVDGSNQLGEMVTHGVGMFYCFAIN